MLRQDYEYRREGTRNRFLTGELLAGWRQVAVTERRTMQDFAQQMRWLVDEAYPEVAVVRLVLDNPVSSTGLYETFPAAEARRIAKRLEFHYYAEARQLAEPGGNRVQRTGPLLPEAEAPDAESLQREVGASVQERNAARVTINWRFKTQDARTKLHRLYPFDS